jgi:hypothetical protein
MAKRDAMSWQKAWLIRGIAIVGALLFSAIVTVLLTGENPIKIYSTMISGAFGTPRRVWLLLQNIAMLLCISLAVTPAFKMRFWNIGAEGQVLIGGLATAAHTLSQGKGIDLDIGGLAASHQENETIKILFGEVPGVLFQVSSLDYDYMDSQLILQDVAYYPVGKPSDTHSGVTVSQSSKANVSDILAALLTQASEGED